MSRSELEELAKGEKRLGSVDMSGFQGGDSILLLSIHNSQLVTGSFIFQRRTARVKQQGTTSKQ